MEQALQDKTKALDALQAELDRSLLQVTELGRQAAQREEAVRGEFQAVRGECESLRAQLVVAHAKEMEERTAREQAQLQARDAGEDTVNELTALLEEQKILAAQAEENRATLGHELNACCAKLAEAQDALNAARAAADDDRGGLQGTLCRYVYTHAYTHTLYMTHTQHTHTHIQGTLKLCSSSLRTSKRLTHGHVKS